jgi:hypothetical protein
MTLIAWRADEGLPKPLKMAAQGLLRLSQADHSFRNSSVGAP